MFTDGLENTQHSITAQDFRNVINAMNSMRERAKNTMVIPFIVDEPGET